MVANAVVMLMFDLSQPGLEEKVANDLTAADNRCR
jgi:hypothetical protein